MSAVSDSVNTTNIIGIVKNIGNKTLNGAGVVVELYDFNNRLINVIEYSPVIVKTLGPNESRHLLLEVWTNTLLFDHYGVRIVGAIG